MRVLPNNIAVLRDDPNVSKWVEECGQLCHDGTVGERILPWLRPGDTVVDAGGYIGSYAFPMAQKIQPNGRLLAFEPNPRAFKALEHNLRGLPGVDCFNAALGSQEDREWFYEHPGNAGASFLPNKPGETRVIPLDTFELPALRFFKIDVEGMEPEVIAGALGTITRHRPVLFIEINHGTLARRGHTYESVVNPLKALEYEIEWTNGSHNFNPTEWPQVDVVFRPRELTL